MSFPGRFSSLSCPVVTPGYFLDRSGEAGDGFSYFLFLRQNRRPGLVHNFKEKSARMSSGRARVMF